MASWYTDSVVQEAEKIAATYIEKAVAEERKAIAEYVRTWGGSPPSPSRRRERLAEEILAGRHKRLIVLDEATAEIDLGT